jgi:hypothetical protein
MTLRFFREFFIDRIPILGAFPLQQFEGSLPNFGAARMQARDDAPCQWSLVETFAPFPDLGACGSH